MYDVNWVSRLNEAGEWGEARCLGERETLEEAEALADEERADPLNRGGLVVVEERPEVGVGLYEGGFVPATGGEADAWQAGYEAGYEDGSRVAESMLSALLPDPAA